LRALHTILVNTCHSPTVSNHPLPRGPPPRPQHDRCQMPTTQSNGTVHGTTVRAWVWSMPGRPRLGQVPVTVGLTTGSEHGHIHGRDDGPGEGRQHGPMGGHSTQGGVGAHGCLGHCPRRVLPLRAAATTPPGGQPSPGGLPWSHHHHACVTVTVIVTGAVPRIRSGTGAHTRRVTLVCPGASCSRTGGHPRSGLARGGRLGAAGASGLPRFLPRPPAYLVAL
jgi:hypothetical protein